MALLPASTGCSHHSLDTVPKEIISSRSKSLTIWVYTFAWEKGIKYVDGMY